MAERPLFFLKNYNIVYFEVIKLISIIGHLDTLLNFNVSNSYDFARDNKNFHVDLVKMKKAEVKIAVFAVFVEPEYKPNNALERTIQLIDRFHNIIEKYKELELVEGWNDVERIMGSNKIGVILAIEGAEGVFDNSALRIFYRLGVRMISLTWNQRNHLADGIGEYEANGGITIKGKEIIKEMERLKIIIDVSHIAAAGFWDIVNITNSPFTASHSNAYRICKNKRNLDDEQIRAIGARNGIIGINFAPDFIDTKKVEISDVIKHIDYIRDITGINTIVLGTDYDGINNTPRCLEDISKINNLAEELYKNKYCKKDIEKIFYENWLVFLKAIWA